MVCLPPGPLAGHYQGQGGRNLPLQAEAGGVAGLQVMVPMMVLLLGQLELVLVLGPLVPMMVGPMMVGPLEFLPGPPDLVLQQLGPL